MDAGSLNQLFYADSVCVCGPQEPRRKQFFLERFNAHGKMMWYKVQVRVHLSGSPSMQKCSSSAGVSANSSASSALRDGHERLIGQLVGDDNYVNIARINGGRVWM
jgi:hypothetical protein